MDVVDKLLAIQQIRRVKAMYCYAMDSRDFSALRDVFADDAVFDLRDERRMAGARTESEDSDGGVHRGADAIVEFLREVQERWTIVHHLHEPVIDLISGDEATGVWPMFDYIDDGDHALKGYGHYHETYRRIDRGWVIAHSRLSRTRVDGEHPWRD
ncbi:nuclear transport factor 2 family protein [Salinibacterium sp. ZJ454]|uniref:nuclear transport factor 2 family protein n=1 Tax=Salinibacterium sp. ZJ454 TaxID=2708339 RepID=UPI00142419C0|nr:nuclear transport factor 2 family protein [Salinibacterium sp. ZJ454]